MTIVITSKRDGFRRCGIAHPGTPTPYPNDFFTDEQLEALGKEPQLILGYVEEAFDQVKDVLDETRSQVPPPQASDATTGTEPQAPETVITPVVAPVVIVEPNSQPGPGFVGPSLDISVVETGPLKDQENTAPPSSPTPTPVMKPEKTRTTKAKGTDK